MIYQSLESDGKFHFYSLSLSGSTMKKRCFLSKGKYSFFGFLMFHQIIFLCKGKYFFVRKYSMKIVNQTKLTINEINFADSTFTSFGTSSSSGSMVLRGRGRMWCSKSRLLELRSNFPLMQIKKIITRIRCKNFIVLKRLVLSVSGCRLK